MMDADKIKYKERSICAINGIRQLISDIQLILSCNTIKGKYYQIAQYIGLATENEKSYYNYFIPINSDIVFLLRFSDHNNTNPSLYNQHERNGRPNKRFIIPFVGNIFQNSGPTPFLGAEHHVVSYPVNALDDEASIKLFLSDLQRLFTNGETNFTQLPQQPIQENNKQINTNKNIMKINESQLRKIIQESINGILNEITSTPGMGWMGLQFEEDDWTPVNEPNEGDVCYKIKLWSGSGYHLDAFKVYAEPNDYETALEILVAYFDRENINTYFVDDWVEEEMEDLREKGVSEDDLYEELSKSGDYYIDATMEGASKPHWLRGENLQMQAFPLKENKKNNKHCSSINEGGYSKLERDIDGKTLLDGAVIRRLRKMAEQIDYISSMSSYKMQDVCSDLLNVFWKHKIY